MSEIKSVEILTAGVDHVGLSVADLSKTVAFFTQCLHWRLTGERPEYPAAFVSDGQTRVTLWQVAKEEPYVAFDRKKNVGLHHLALRVKTTEDLHRLHERVLAFPGIVTEFSPEPSSGGPRIHFMIREPGGCRIEFVCDPRLGER
jgi:catechol 2,3-dioxygenase-like lactoylglutathione lyase family enzyme